MKHINRKGFIGFKLNTLSLETSTIDECKILFWIENNIVNLCKYLNIPAETVVLICFS